MVTCTGKHAWFSAQACMRACMRTVLSAVHIHAHAGEQQHRAKDQQHYRQRDLLPGLGLALQPKVRHVGVGIQPIFAQQLGALAMLGA